MLDIIPCTQNLLTNHLPEQTEENNKNNFVIMSNLTDLRKFDGKYFP